MSAVGKVLARVVGEYREGANRIGSAIRALIEEACPEAKFSALRTGKVKNVAEPLRYFALDVDSV